MSLASMTPDPDWAPDAHPDALARLAAVADGLTVRIWCGDWCGDCHRLLPPFAAALESIDVPPEAIEVYPVEKRADGTKVGDRVEAFAVDRTPTVVLMRDGEEIARFEEGRTPGPIVAALGDQLAEVEIETG